MAALSLAQLRRCYAEELRAAAPVRRHEAVVKAFATVPRDAFFGTGPWSIIPPKQMSARYVTPDADPRHLYHDVLIAIDAEKGINNGEPGLWARLLDQIEIKRGARILQVGAGTGYYSAILAQLAGPKGRVIAVEYEAALARAARRHLRPWRQIKVVQGDGTRHDPGKVDAVIVFAGATHPAPLWLTLLNDGGQLLMPLTGHNGWGIFLKVTRHGATYAAESLGSCGFFPCVGARDDAAARRLQQRMTGLHGRAAPIKSLHCGKPPLNTRDLWYAGPGFWLSRS
nr:methyltransferase domain-containing protein [uncultured Dongia sp.]